jgi:DNA-binding transcriptional MerR regulator
LICVVDLTIDQLAAETGLTVRNIRNHQSRGLLPPPDVRARVGYYGPQHVERLRLIREMQADGFNLNAIKQVINGSADQFLGFKRAVTTPFESETSEILTAEELTRRLGELPPKALERAQRLGLLVPLPDGRFEAPSPALLRAAEEAVERGIPLRIVLDVTEGVRKHMDAVAKRFVELFLEQVWEPFQRDGRPGERWPEVTESLERLRPLASSTVLALFQQRMTARVERTFGEQLERELKRHR